MKVYRISSEKWASNLRGSGRAARWNSNGSFLCYTSSSMALSSLEMLVHVSGEILAMPFKMVTIDIPEQVKIQEIQDLEVNWFEYENYFKTQLIGDEWIRGFESAVLKVPSAIIKKEFNYLLNPSHPQFQLITLEVIDDFHFDSRLIP